MAETSDESTNHIQNGNYGTEGITDTTIRDRASSAGSSDSEGGERPVRDQLKKTSIAGMSSKAKVGADKPSYLLQEPSTGETAEPAHLAAQVPVSSRGRLARKRSFDDLQNDDSANTSQAEGDDAPPAKNGHHKRMRSRDMSSGEHISMPGKSEDGVTSTVEEESDIDAQKSPGGPGLLIDASTRDAVTPPPEDSAADPESMISPKKKRSRDQFDKEDSAISDSLEPQPTSNSHKKINEPDKKRHREEDQAASVAGIEPPATIMPSSGFANASSASPFGAFASSKSPSGRALSPDVKPAEPSAFKSSGLSAFASSEKSPFGAIGSVKSTGFGGTLSSGGFGSTSTNTGFGGTSASGFGNTRSTSPFSTQPGAGFGSLSSLASTGAFGSAGSFGAGLGTGLGGAATQLGGGASPFGGPVGSSSTFGGPSTSKQKAFGAPEDEDDSDSGDDSGSQDDDGAEAEESHHAREARLKEQTDRETGEEDEEVVIKCRAKLYHFENKEWKERGVGDLKVNVRFEAKHNSDEDTPQYERKARIIMRTEHVHRVVLNTPIFKGMKVGNQSGDEPNGKFLNLGGMENGKPALFMLKIGKDEVVKELYHRIKELQEEP